MSEQMSLGGILDEKSPPPDRTPEPAASVGPAQAAPEPSAEPAPERPRGPDGKFLSKEAVAEGKEPAKTSEPPKQETVPEKPPVPQEEFTPKERAFLARAQDETRKRQALEAKLAQLEAAKPAEPAKQFWDDPDAALKKHMQDVQTMLMNTKLNTAEAIARSKHTDFEEKVAVFAEVLQNTPGLHQQWMSAPDPAEFAYSLGKNHLELRQAGDLDSLRAKIEKETRLRLEAEYKAKFEADAKARAALPGSLTDSHSAGINKPSWGGPTSLDSILK